MSEVRRAKITYSPNRNYHGEDSFTFTIASDTNKSDMAIAKLTIMDVNDAPVARDQLVTIEVDHAIDEVNQERSYIGSEQNKLQFTMST